MQRYFSQLSEKHKEEAIAKLAAREGLDEEEYWEDVADSINDYARFHVEDGVLTVLVYTTGDGFTAEAI